MRWLESPLPLVQPLSPQDSQATRLRHEHGQAQVSLDDVHAWSKAKKRLLNEDNSWQRTFEFVQDCDDLASRVSQELGNLKDIPRNSVLSEVSDNRDESERYSQQSNTLDPPRPVRSIVNLTVDQEYCCLVRMLLAREKTLKLDHWPSTNAHDSFPQNIAILRAFAPTHKAFVKFWGWSAPFASNRQVLTPILSAFARLVRGLNVVET
ncbi:hypothetical protein CC78DRAFT_538894 [Lojkania enalia]|uniref:Uncharacterized protein n=1 Tax=Lojkania enalia TaxID=147567 RepID=A0A9P4NBY0_9PLEO|nr:hypothetical protein CC78DRAFT_538894 [Didymosphaeria enalia]